MRRVRNTVLGVGAAVELLALWSGTKSWAEFAEATQVQSEPQPGESELPRLTPLEPEAALAAFRIREGFRVELAAAEPSIQDPVAACFDADGSLFVVEMRGYSERQEERLGRVRRLRDRDGDGFYEESRVWAEGFRWPTGIACWGDGAFVLDSPDLWRLRDPDGDGSADQRERAWTGFGDLIEKVNVQGLPNNLRWGPDGRIHGAASINGALLRPGEGPIDDGLLLRGDDFSFDPEGHDMQREFGGGQHGMAFDDLGRRYTCHNSRHLELFAYAARYGTGRGAALPSPRVGIAVDGPAAEVYRLSPDEPWRIVRTRWRIAGLVDGPVEGGGRVSGYFTSAAGIEVYRGDIFPEEYRGNVFVGDVGSNIVHRKVLHRLGESPVPEARRAAGEEQREFLASTDNWFRPVQCLNGPDGALYVVDMYREVIEHPWSVPESIKARLDLNSGNDRGRIYRIVPEKWERGNEPALSALWPEDWVMRLNSASGWKRETAARLLVERGTLKSTNLLRRRLLAGELTPLGVRQALAVLAAREQPTHELLLTASASGDPLAVLPALEHSERLRLDQEVWQKRLSEWASHPDPAVRFQLCLTVSQSDIAFDPAQDDWRETVVRSLTVAGGDEHWMPAAVAMAGAGLELKMFAWLFEEGMLWTDKFRKGLGRLVAKGVAARGTEAERATLAEILGRAALGTEPSAWELTEAFVRELPAQGISWRTVFGENRGDRLRLAGRDRLSPAAGSGRESAAVWAVLAYLEGVDEELVRRVLAPQHGESVQKAAVGWLEAAADSEAVNIVAAEWPGLSPVIRSEALEMMIRRPARAQLLMEAVKDGRIPASGVGARVRQFLVGHSDSALRALATEIWEGEPLEQGNEAFERLKSAVELEGDFDTGQRIYRERCAACHRSGSEGAAFGPDLEAMRRAGREKNLVNLLDPSREVAPEFEAYQVETGAGETLLGIVARETEQRLVLRLPGGIESSLERSELREVRGLGISAMPPGLCEDLGPEDVAGLLRFVEGSAPEAP